MPFQMVGWFSDLCGHFAALLTRREGMTRTGASRKEGGSVLQALTGGVKGRCLCVPLLEFCEK